MCNDHVLDAIGFCALCAGSAYGLGHAVLDNPCDAKGIAAAHAAARLGPIAAMFAKAEPVGQILGGRTMHPIGRQIEEAIAAYQPLDRKQLRERSIALLEGVGIPEAAERARHYPHQLSAGNASVWSADTAFGCGV